MAATSVFLIALAITTSIFIEQAKYTTIAFYNVPETVEEAIKPIISQDLSMVQFKDLTETEYLAPKLNKKVQMIIAYNDATIQELSKKALNLPKAIKEKYPNSIKKSDYYTDRNQMVVQPILLDQFEAVVLRNAINKSEIQIPETFTQLGNFGRAAKWYYPLPIIITGAEDINVNSFITLMVNAFGGKAGYDNVAKQLKEIAKTTDDFYELLDINIGGDADSELTVRSLLNILKEWQNDNYFDAEWYIRNEKNTSKFIENAISALMFMNMTEHRNKPNPNIRYYIPMEIPVETAANSVSVQPAIVSLTFKNNEKTKIIQNRLAQTQNQETLSNITKLAPTILAGEAYDSLATNARFVAASTFGGPVPDLATISLSTEAERHAFAETIRNYLK